MINTIYLCAVTHMHCVAGSSGPMFNHIVIQPGSGALLSDFASMISSIEHTGNNVTNMNQSCVTADPKACPARDAQCGMKAWDTVHR